jgi:hypothetical protein
MPLDTLHRLFHHCLIRGTSFAESGVRVYVNPQSEEKVHFFVLDDQANPDCTLRQDLEMSGRICDILVSYARQGKNKTILCLVELKGKNLERAAEQVVNTCRYLWSYLEKQLEHSAFRKIEWTAYLCRHKKSRAPSKRTDRAKKTLRDFGRFSKCDITRNSDLGRFLRN